MTAGTCLGTIWVCLDCMLVHANGECGENPDRPPLGEIPFGCTLTMGLLAEEHAETCQVRITGSWPENYECDCETNTFSTSSCDGCGSVLAGERHAMALWREHTIVEIICTRDSDASNEYEVFVDGKPYKLDGAVTVSIHTIDPGASGITQDFVNSNYNVAGLSPAAREAMNSIVESYADGRTDDETLEPIVIPDGSPADHAQTR